MFNRSRGAPARRTRTTRIPRDLPALADVARDIMPKGGSTSDVAARPFGENGT